MVLRLETGDRKSGIDLRNCDFRAGVEYQGEMLLQARRERMQAKLVVEHPDQEQKFVKCISACSVHVVAEGDIGKTNVPDTGIDLENCTLCFEGERAIHSPLYLSVPQRAGKIDICLDALFFTLYYKVLVPNSH
jgi:hypothetical protein